MSKTGRWAVAGVAVLGTAIVAYRIHLASASDETRIRRLVSRVEEAFNDGSAGAIASSLAEDFRQEPEGLSRDEVKLFLTRLFFTERVPRTREPRHVVKVAPEDVLVSLPAEEAPAAEITVTARFFTRPDKGEELSPSAVLLITGGLVKVKGDWRISRASSKVIEGRWPF